MKLLLNPTLILLLLISGCRSANNDNASVRVISFGVNSGYEFSGTFYDEISHEERVYFVKNNFNPNVRIFDTKANLVETVSLAEAEKNAGKISTVWMNTLDTIYVLSTNRQVVAVVNREGNLILLKKLSDYNQDESGNRYDLYPPFLQAVQMGCNNEIVLTTFWSENMTFFNKNRTERTLGFVNDNIRNGYLMRKISFTADDADICFGVRITDFKELSGLGSSLFLPFYKTIILNNRYFLMSHYSRYIYELNSDLTVHKAVKIIPDDYPLAAPVVINETENIPADHEDELDKQHNETNCYIANMLYDDGRFLFLIKNGLADDDLFSFPFDICIYDESLDKMIKEHVVPSSDYIPKSSFIMDGDLYIERKNESHNTKEYECIKM